MRLRFLFVFSCFSVIGFSQSNEKIIRVADTITFKTNQAEFKQMQNKFATHNAILSWNKKSYLFGLFKRTKIQLESSAGKSTMKTSGKEDPSVGFLVFIDNRPAAYQRLGISRIKLQ